MLSNNARSICVEIRIVTKYIFNSFTRCISGDDRSSENISNNNGKQNDNSYLTEIIVDNQSIIREHEYHKNFVSHRQSW